MFKYPQTKKRTKSLNGRPKKSPSHSRATLPATFGQRVGAEAKVNARPKHILGVDPGSRITGYAFLRARRPEAILPTDFEIVEAGVLRADASLAHGMRIGLLHEALHDLAARLKPDICVIERAFSDKNVASAIKLGELRGAYIAACARLEIAVEEITPAEVKKAVAGNGRAEKEAIAFAVKTLTGFDRGALPHDVTDALAIALCFGMSLVHRWSPLGQVSSGEWR